MNGEKVVQRYRCVGYIDDIKTGNFVEDDAGAWILHDDYAALLRERDALREALRPLAELDLRPGGMGSRPDDSVVYARDKSRITVGDVKRARALLTADAEGGE